MKFNLLNNDQIQIIITKTDLLNKNMRTLFHEILEQANQDYGFEVMRDTNLMVEAYPLSDESMILTITKFDELDIDFGKFNTDSIFNEPWAVFAFSDIEDVIHLSKIIAGNFTGKSMLFKYENKFYLYLDDVNEVPEIYRGYFMEYGTSTMLTLPFLTEHAQKMIDESAIHTLCQL